MRTRDGQQQTRGRARREREEGKGRQEGRDCSDSWTSWGPASGWVSTMEGGGAGKIRNYEKCHSSNKTIRWRWVTDDLRIANGAALRTPKERRIPIFLSD